LTAKHSGNNENLFDKGTPNLADEDAVSRAMERRGGGVRVLSVRAPWRARVCEAGRSVRAAAAAGQAAA